MPWLTASDGRRSGRVDPRDPAADALRLDRVDAPAGGLDSVQHPIAGGHVDPLARGVPRRRTYTAVAVAVAERLDRRVPPDVRDGERQLFVVAAQHDRRALTGVVEARAEHRPLAGTQR